ncbi:isochorismatase [Lederbergia panacisoli]|nr:isochorismatase [Lederbergia panacisoli]MCR2822110.1 isochorismatase [Lederbergia panacisoli]
MGYEVILAKDANSTYDMDILKADQIINHHNQIHDQWFACVMKTKEITF